MQIPTLSTVVILWKQHLLEGLNRSLAKEGLLFCKMEVGEE